MNFNKRPLSAGLYFVSTPIGSARDITLRALDVLASADVLVAEDTRSLKKLLMIHGVPLGDRPVWSYHDHSKDRDRERVLDRINSGESVAYASEAGTPLVADPGYALSRAVIDADLPVTAAPGATAAVTALTLSGLPTDKFFFVGFLPPAKVAREKAIAELRDVPGTLIFYESAKRVHGMFNDLCEVLGRDRKAALCRELTKTFEEVLRGTLAEVVDQLDGRDLKGECVVLVARADEDNANDDDVEAALLAALETMRVKDAATAVAGAMGRPRREVYQLALELERRK